MDLQQLHPELQASFKKIPNFPYHNWWFRRALPALVNLCKSFRKEKPTPGVATSLHRAGKVSVKVYRATTGQPRGAVLWFHGGGYILGDASVNDVECNLMALKANVLVASVNYRLAPENPFPAALEDGVAAWRWLRVFAEEQGINPTQIIVAGQSAGGGLAAACVQKLFDEAGEQPAAQMLLYPMLDDRTANNRELDVLGHRMWSNRSNRAAWRMYLGQEPGEDTLWSYAAPARRSNLSGLPPAWIGVGQADLFYEECVQYSERLQACSVTCEFVSVPGAPHAFDAVAADTQLSRQFRENYLDFLNRVCNSEVY